MAAMASLAFLPGSPGPGELLLLFLAILLLFGPRRLPEMARKVGRMLEALRRASYEFRDQIMAIGAPDADKAPYEDGRHERTGARTGGVEPREPLIPGYDIPEVEEEAGGAQPEREEESGHDLAG